MKQKINERLLLFLLALVQFANILDGVLMMPLNPFIRESFVIKPFEFSIAVSAYTLAACLSGFAAALFIDRFDRKPFLVLTFVGFVLGTLACGLSTNYTLLVAARFLTGAFGGILGAQVMAIIGDVIPNERRARGMSVVMMAFSVASIAGIPLALSLAESFSWKMPFIVLASFSVLVLILIVLVLPSIKGHINREQKNIYATLFKNGNQLSALLFMSLLMLGQFTIIPFIADYMVSNVGLKTGQLWMMYLTGGILTVVSAPIIGKLSDKFPRKNIYTISAILYAIPVIVLGQMGHTPLALALVVNGAFFIVMGGRMIPSMALITSTAQPQERGGFMTIVTAVQHLAMSVAVLIAGAVVSAPTPKSPLIGFDTVGFIAIGFSIISLWAVRRLKAVS